MTDHAVVDGVADKLRDCFLSGAFDPSLFTDDFRLWRNVDRRMKTLDQVAREVAWELRKTAVEHRAIVRQASAKGFVEQFEALFLAFPGTVVDVAMIVELRDDRIVRIDEYLDSRQASVLAA